MKARLFLLMSIVVLAAIGLAAIGCGGGDGDADANLTPEEYFRQVKELADGLGQQGDALAAKWEEDLASATSDQDRLELTGGFYDALFSLIGPFRDDLADIEAPEEVQEAHKDLLDRADELSSAWSEISAEVRGAESEAELEGLVTGGDFITAGQRFEEGCLELQRIADDMEIDVDLECQD